MNWIKAKVTKLAIWWLKREQGRSVEVSTELAGHLEGLNLFSQGDYKAACERVPTLLKKLDWLKESTSGIEEEVNTALVDVKDVATKLAQLRRGLLDAYKAIIKAAAAEDGDEDGEGFECLVQNAEDLKGVYETLASETKEAVNKVTAATTAAAVAMPDIRKVADMAEKIGEKFLSVEQKLVQMVEQGRALVSTTAINNVAKRFKDVARKQGYKIICLWAGIFGLSIIVFRVSRDLWDRVNTTGTDSTATPAAVDNLPLFLSLRSAIFGVLTALIIFLYRAIKPAEEERREYQMKATVLAASMAVHKESLSAPLQRVIAEELGWKSTIKSLNIFLKENDTLWVENLLAEEVNVSGYEIICWDEEGRRVDGIPNALAAHEVLAGREELPVVEVVDINMVRRVEIRDAERNVISRWVKPFVRKRRDGEDD